MGRAARFLAGCQLFGDLRHDLPTAPSHQACGPLLDVAADDIEHKVDGADCFQRLVVEVDELLRAEVERLLTVGGSPGADDVRARQSSQLRRHRPDCAGRAGTGLAFDALSDAEFAAMMPGLLVMFGKGGWLFLLWGIVLLPIGFGIQAMGLLASRSFARHRSLLFMVGVLFIGTPDGAEIVNLTAADRVAVSSGGCSLRGGSLSGASAAHGVLQSP